MAGQDKFVSVDFALMNTKVGTMNALPTGQWALPERSPPAGLMIGL